MITNKFKACRYFSYSYFLLYKNDKLLAKKYYLLSLVYGGKRSNLIEKKLDALSAEKGKKIKIAVSGWELSHNAAGRAITLAELYHYAGFDNVEMIGCIINSNNKQVRKIWEPLLLHHIPVRFFSISKDDIGAVLPKAMEFVIQNPYDIVHLSKPRITNIIIGLLYKLIWGSTVIIDIDDEELAFSTQNESLDNEEKSKNIRDFFWTKKAIELIDFFDLISVSNPALQKKYGGLIIPHVRNENIFYPSESRKNASRKKYNIPLNKIVVLFFGTPKRHKGIVETAKVLAALNDDRITYTIVGDFQDKDLKTELESIADINIDFLPNQRFDKASDVVAMGDICILLQDTSSEISKYQLPAKLVDALGMGLKVFIQKTEATANLLEGGQIKFVSSSNLACSLKSYLENEYGKESKVLSQREYFLKKFSMSSVIGDISQIIKLYENNIYSLDVNYKNLSYYSKFDLLGFLKEYKNQNNDSIF